MRIHELTKMTPTTALAAMTVALLSTAAYAMPSAIPYTGQLTYASGAPYEGTITLTVAIHGHSTATDLLWGPVEYTDVSVERGVFSVMLGDITDPSMDQVWLDDDTVWLQFSVGPQALTPRQQEILHLVFYHEMTIQEAAAIVKMPVGTARTHYERGKKNLRCWLGKRKEELL